MTRRRALTLLGISILALALVAGHVVYWYLPRARPADPRGDTAAGSLLASDAYPVALWMPYPHQNLGFLRRAAGAEPASLEALGRLAGLPAPGLPAFGSFAVPPASELAAASDEAGERWVIVAQVFPAFAAFAKLAGRLAGNPWLTGGEVYTEGRRAEVVWRGNRWLAASPELPELATAGGRSESPEPALAIVQVRQALHPLPSGSYRLIRRGAALEIVAGAAATESPDFEQLGLAELGAFLLAIAGRVEALGEPDQAMVGFTSDAGDRLELPRVAAVYEPGGERWPLPGETILEIAGSEPRRAEAAGWSIAALDADSLEGALRLAPRLATIFRRPASEGRLVWGLWLDLGAGLREVSRIAERLAEVPIVPRRRLERWRDAETVLTPLAERYPRLTLVVTEEPRSFRLRLEPGDRRLD